MKKYILFLLASVFSTLTFAQIVSGEVTFNSAPSMSGEINIDLPFDPLEVENNGKAPFWLNSATNVKTGADSIVAIMLAMLLGAALYNYRVRTQKDS